jgi:signal peptidase II
MQRKYLLLIALAGLVVVLDQWTKYVVLRDLTVAFDGADTFGERVKAMTTRPPMRPDGYHYQQKAPVTVSENFLRLRYAENLGAAFGLFRTLPEGVRGPLFHVVSIGAVILISLYFSKLTGTDPQEKWALWGLPLVLGGAIGNYLDRLARGFVVDFIEAHWFDKAAWPSFNVADTAICVGIGMLMIDAVVRKEKKEAAAPT